MVFEIIFKFSQLAQGLRYVTIATVPHALLTLVDSLAPEKWSPTAKVIFVFSCLVHTNLYACRTLFRNCGQL